MANTVKQPAMNFTITDGDGAVHTVTTATQSITTTGNGFGERYYTTSTSYATIDFADFGLTTEQFCLFQNVDDTDNVIIAAGAAANEQPFADLEPGCVCVTWLDGAETIRVKSSANTPRVRVVAAED